MSAVCAPAREFLDEYGRCMTSEHPNATAYRRTADAFRDGDSEAVAALIDEDVVWHVPGNHEMAGDVVGRDALLDWLMTLGPRGFWLSERDVFGNDEHVCALSSAGIRREGVDVQTDLLVSKGAKPTPSLAVDVLRAPLE